MIIIKNLKETDKTRVLCLVNRLLIKLRCVCKVLSSGSIESLYQSNRKSTQLNKVIMLNYRHVF